MIDSSLYGKEIAYLKGCTNLTEATQKLIREQHLDPKIFAELWKITHPPQSTPPTQEEQVRLMYNGLYAAQQKRKLKQRRERHQAGQ